MVKDYSYNKYAGEGPDEAPEVDKITIKEKTDGFKKEFEELMQDKSVENIKNIEFFLQSVEKTIELANQVKDAKSVKRFKSQLNDLMTKANELLQEINGLTSTESQAVEDNGEEILKTEQEKIEPEIIFQNEENVDTKVIADDINRFMNDYSKDFNNITKDKNRLQEHKIKATDLLNDLNLKIARLEGQKNSTRELSGLNKLKGILENLIEEMIVLEGSEIQELDVSEKDKIITTSDTQEKTLSDRLDDFCDFKINKTNNIQELNDFLHLCERLKNEVSSQKYITRIENSIVEVNKKIELLSKNIQSGDNINTNEKEQKGPKIILPKDEALVRALQDKLEEYKKRLISRQQKDFYKAPELFTDTNYKIAILENLLLDGEVDTYAISKKLMQIYGFVDAQTFENACRVIEEYAKDGGRSVRGGTGLKIKETIINSQPETPKEVEPLVDTSKEEGALSETQQSSGTEKIADVAESPSEAKESSEPKQQEKTFEDRLNDFYSFKINKNNNIEDLQAFIVLCKKLKKEVSGKKDRIRIQNAILEANKRIEILSKSPKSVDNINTQEVVDGAEDVNIKTTTSENQEKVALPKNEDDQVYDLYEFEKIYSEFINFAYFDPANESKLDEYLNKAENANKFLDRMESDHKSRKKKLLKDDLNNIKRFRELTDNFIAGILRVQNKENMTQNQNQKQEKKGFFSKIKSWFKSQSQYEEKTGIGEILQDKEATDKKLGKISKVEQKEKKPFFETVKSKISKIWDLYVTIPKTPQEKQEKEAKCAAANKFIYNVLGSICGVKAIGDWLGAGLAVGLDKVGIDFKLGKRTDVYKYFEQKKSISRDKELTKVELSTLIDSIKPTNERMQIVYNNPKYQKLVLEMDVLLKQYKEEKDKYEKQEAGSKKTETTKIKEFNKLHEKLLNEIKIKGTEKSQLREKLVEKNKIDIPSLKESAIRYNNFINNSRTVAYYDLPKKKREEIEEKIKFDSLSDKEKEMYLLSDHDKKTMKIRLGSIINETIEDKNGLSSKNQKNIDKVLGDYILGTVRGTMLVKDVMNTAFVFGGGLAAAGFRGVSYAGFSGEEKAFRYDVKDRKEYSWNVIGEKMKLNTKLVDLLRSSFAETYYGLKGKRYQSYFGIENNKLKRGSRVETLSGDARFKTFLKSFGEVAMILGIGGQTLSGIFSQGMSVENGVNAFVNTFKGDTTSILGNIQNNFVGYVDISSRLERAIHSLDQLKDVALAKGASIFHHQATGVEMPNHITGADHASDSSNLESSGQFKAMDYNVDQLKGMSSDQIHEIANHGLVVAKGSSVSETLNMNVPLGSKMTLITINKLGNPITHENVDANLVAPGARVMVDSSGHITLIDENSNHASWYEYYIKNPGKVAEAIEAGKIAHSAPSKLDVNTPQEEVINVKLDEPITPVEQTLTPPREPASLETSTGEDITHGTLTTEGKIGYHDLLNGDQNTIRQFLVFNRPGGLFSNGELSDQDLGTDFDKIYYNADLTTQAKLDIFSKIQQGLENLKSTTLDNNAFASLSNLQKEVANNIKLLDQRLFNEYALSPQELQVGLGTPSKNILEGVPIEPVPDAAPNPSELSVESETPLQEEVVSPEPVSPEIPKGQTPEIPETPNPVPLQESETLTEPSSTEIPYSNELQSELVKGMPQTPAQDILDTSEIIPPEYVGESQMVRFDDYGEFNNIHAESHLENITIGDKVYDINVSEVMGNKITGIAIDDAGHQSHIEFTVTDNDSSGGGADLVTAKFGAEINASTTALYEDLNGKIQEIAISNTSSIGSPEDGFAELGQTEKAQELYQNILSSNVDSHQKYELLHNLCDNAVRQNEVSQNLFGSFDVSKDASGNILFDGKLFNENTWQDILISRGNALSQVKIELNNIISHDNLLPKEVLSQELSSVAPTNMYNSAIDTFLNPEKNFVTKISALQNALQDGERLDIRGMSFAKKGEDIYYMVNSKEGIKLDSVADINKILANRQSAIQKILKVLR